LLIQSSDEVGGYEVGSFPVVVFLVLNWVVEYDDSRREGTEQLFFDWIEDIADLRSVNLVAFFNVFSFIDIVDLLFLLIDRLIANRFPDSLSLSLKTFLVVTFFFPRFPNRSTFSRGGGIAFGLSAGTTSVTNCLITWIEKRA